MTNLGPNAVDELMMVDEIPASISGAVFTAASGTYDGSTGLLTGISLDGGESVELTIAGQLAEDAAGTLINRAVVSVTFRIEAP